MKILIDKNCFGNDLDESPNCLLKIKNVLLFLDRRKEVKRDIHYNGDVLIKKAYLNIQRGSGSKTLIFLNAMKSDPEQKVMGFKLLSGIQRGHVRSFEVGEGLYLVLGKLNQPIITKHGTWKLVKHEYDLIERRRTYKWICVEKT